MPPDIQAIKSELGRLSNNEAIIDLLLPLLRHKATLPADDIGWAFWNICDCYAMLRKAKEQYAYQSEFHEWSKSGLPSLKHHWVVSDGTQAMTLISGGFIDFWWNCYQFANQSAPQIAENRTVRFESHRANAAAYTHFREFSRAETALQSLEAVLSEDPLWSNHDFATATWITLLIEYYAASGQPEQVAKQVEAVDRYLGDWLARLQRPVVWTVEPILGSWRQLSADRQPGWVFVALHNAACALVVARQFADGERLFRIFLQERPDRMTTYSKALYLLACWHNRRNKAEIQELLAVFQPDSLQQIVNFAPELTEVLGE